MLLERSGSAAENDFQLSQSTRNALGELEISVELMSNGEDVVASLARGNVHIGFVSERYLDVVHKAYATEIAVIAEISRGIPLGIARRSFLQNYAQVEHTASASSGSFGLNILSGKNVAVMAKTMGATIASDFDPKRETMKPPTLVPAYSFEQMAELLATGAVELALGWEPEVTLLLQEMDRRAQSSGAGDAAKFDRLPDFALSERQVKFYLVCGRLLPFNLLVRYLKALRSECRYLNSYLQNREADYGPSLGDHNEDQTVSSIAARVDKHIGVISDPKTRVDSLWRVLRTAHFEVADLNVDGLIKMHEWDEARRRV